MTVTLTYDGTLSRIRVDATALAAATYATVERSTDNVHWSTVRGGTAAVVTAGVMTTVDDYEFVDGVVNTYRVRGVETGAITYVAAGTAAAANNASVTPALPAGILAGDLLVTLASIRNSGTGTVNTPAGWTTMADFGNMRLIGRRYVAGDAAPAITFASGVANADTLARMVAFRRADLIPVTTATKLNTSAANVAYPALTTPAPNLAILVAGWKQDDWTSVAAIGGMTEAWEQAATTGDDAAQVLDYVIQTAAADIPAGSLVVTGGASAISRSIVVALQHAPYLNEQTATTTPALSAVWLKSIARPFLNRAVKVIDWSDITRPSRSSSLEIKDRSYPVAITQPRGSRRWTMRLKTTSAADALTMSYVLAAGDVMFIHVPAAYKVPGGYVDIADVGERQPALWADPRQWTLPMTESAPPGPDVVGATTTWQTVIATYGTWADVIAAAPTWEALLAQIAAPSTVVVP